jgi:hypothetical protein
MPLVKPSLKAYTVVLGFTAALAAPIWSAAQDAANRAQIIHQQASEAVVLAETRNANEEPVGQATAFFEDLVAEASIDRALKLLTKREKEAWSEDPDSRYQQLILQVKDLLEPTIPTVRSADVLTTLAQHLSGIAEIELELAVSVARQRAVVSPNNGPVLYAAAEALRTAAVYSTGTREDELYKEAEKYALTSVALSSVTDKRQRVLSLGRIQIHLDGKIQTGITNLLQVVSPSNDDLTYDAALELFSAYKSLGRAADAVEWFDFADRIKAGS